MDQPARSRRWLWAGALCWLLSAGYFLAQVVVAARWPLPYSVRDNFVSDLGVTSCGEFSDYGVSRYVCSPAHDVMNAALFLAGALTAVGAVLIAHGWAGDRRNRWGHQGVAVAGAGAAAVGLLPWDVHPTAHDVVALAQLPFQLVGMALIAAGTWRSARSYALWALICLIASGVGTVAFLFTRGYFGLGVGVAERLCLETPAVWGIVAGVLLLFRARTTRDRAPATSGGAAS